MAQFSPEQESDIAEARSQSATTRRPTVPALERVLHSVFPALNHGFIRVVDYMGDDAAVVQAARVSYGRGTRRVSEDQGLINYLMRHHHTTPFEMCEIKYHVKLPIFVARQWIRHRTANVNEYSARYSILDKEFYIPEPEHIAIQSSTNRQGRGELLTRDEAAKVQELLRLDAEGAYESYEALLNDDGSGKPRDASEPMLARELARMNLSLNFYTQWYWKVDLHNLFNFLSLRADAHAQYEIRVYADIMLDLTRQWVPLSCTAFEEHRLNAYVLSRSAKDVMGRVAAGAQVTQANSGLTKREWDELTGALGVFGVSELPAKEP